MFPYKTKHTPNAKLLGFFFFETTIQTWSKYTCIHYNTKACVVSTTLSKDLNDKL